jgi:hypothetical protein
MRYTRVSSTSLSDAREVPALIWNYKYSTQLNTASLLRHKNHNKRHNRLNGTRVKKCSLLCSNLNLLLQSWLHDRYNSAHDGYVLPCKNSSQKWVNLESIKYSSSYVEVGVTSSQSEPKITFTWQRWVDCTFNWTLIYFQTLNTQTEMYNLICVCSLYVLCIQNAQKILQRVYK